MEPFKNQIGPQLVTLIADAIADQTQEFPRNAFVAHALAGLEEMEMRARVEHLAETLARHLPDDFERSVGVLLASLGEASSTETPTTAAVNDVRGFAIWPMTRYVSLRGLEHVELALDALEEMTRRFTAEFDIREFIEARYEETMARLAIWVEHPDAHVRRLVSEGTRPRLPWGRRLKRFQDDPAPALALLERLRDDESPYVRRSVANHLNDISKDHPQIALEVARAWLVDAPEPRARLVRHPQRSLVRDADPDALELLGFNGKIDLDGLFVGDACARGEKLPLAFRIWNAGEAPAKVVVDYMLHLVKASGDRRPRAFRISSRKLAPGAVAAYERTHDFRSTSVRQYYPGRHRLEIRVNGRTLGGEEFHLR